MDNNKQALPGQWLFYLIAAIGMLISLFLWYAFVSQSAINLTHLSQLETEHVAEDIHNQIGLRISALKHMAKYLQQPESKSSFLQWQQNANDWLSDYDGFEGVAWVDASFKVRWLSSKNNTSNILFTDLINLYKNTLISSKQIWVSPVIAIRPGEKGLFVSAPIFNADKSSNGFLLSIVNLKQALTVPSSENDYDIMIVDEGQEVIKRDQDSTNDRAAPFVSSLNLYGSVWKVYVRPTSKLINTIQNQLPNIALLLGISLAILFAFASRFALLARARARSLAKINCDLKREIAERMQAEETKRKLERALLQGQKLQAIGTLAGGIAHDFNNILYAIIGYTEMAREDIPADGIIHENLGKVLEASKRAQELISRILAFGRRQQHHEFRAVPLKETIENVLALLRPTIPASISIDYQSDVPEECSFFGDVTQLHQIMVNVINNAVDAMDGDGTVTIRLSYLLATDAELKQFPAIGNKNYCKIEISDTGHGMDPGTIERIFEPFFTTKEVGKGTGLGLSTVHAIIKEHQGEIAVASQLGHGTVFTLYLPEYSPKLANKTGA